MKNLVGEDFGFLSVIEKTDKKYKNGEIVWRVKCNRCGNEKEMKTSDVKRCISCGCLKGRPRKNRE